MCSTKININEPDSVYLYRDLLAKVLDGIKVGNTTEVMGATISVNLADCRSLIIPGRTNLAYMLGELTWYLSADNSLEFISKFGKMWNNLSDDGETCNSAYGHLLMNDPFNQIEQAIQILKNDKNSRRAVMNINRPNMFKCTTKDSPCTISIQYMIRNNKLHCFVNMRSNDVWLGLPYDIIFFTELQKYIAARLSVDAGFYYHNVASLHLYDRDIVKVKDWLNGCWNVHAPEIDNGRLFDLYPILKMASQHADDPKTMIVDIAYKLGVLK